MKTIVLMVEGAADGPVAALDDRTPLELARLHVASRWARAGCAGVIPSLPQPPFWRPEAMLGVCAGQAAEEVFGWRRGPVEALALPEPAPGAWMYRADFVTLDDGMVRDAGPRRLGFEETEALVAALADRFEPEGWRLRATGPGTAVIGTDEEEETGWEGLPPQWLEGIEPGEVRGQERMPERLRGLSERAARILSCHPVNDIRVDLGENPANGLWLWGGGPRIGRATEAREAGGVVLTNSLLGRGIAAACGCRTLELDWPREGGEAAAPFAVPALVEVLREVPLLLVHVGAGQPGGRYGTARDKIRTLDQLDQELLGTLRVVIEAYRPYRLVLAADSAVSSESGRPREGVVPLVLCGDGIEPDEVERWNEQACADGGLGSMKLRDFWDRIEMAATARE